MSEQPGPTSPDCESTLRAWARYWASGALHSCATSFADNYDGAVGSFWRSTFSVLQPGDRVLDVATGNGALAKLLIESRPDTSICCDAIDLAPVAPGWVRTLPMAQRQRLRFQGQIQAEVLPFEDGRFALAVSQFGLEYSALERSVPELLRVLRRPSEVALVVHHGASRPTTLAAEELRHIDWLLQPEGLIGCTLGLLRPMSQSSTAEGRAALSSDADAIALRARFNALQKDLSARAAHSDCPDLLHEVREAIAHCVETAIRHGEVAATAQLRTTMDAVHDNRTRLADLRRAALDETGLRSMVARFGSTAQRVERIEDAGLLMGWSVRLTLE